MKENSSDKPVRMSFVILHYLTINETRKCVESILKNIDSNECVLNIVIVDNASPNESGKELKELYRGQKNIHVIINEQNLGFSRGNNVGFKFAKEKLNSDFIVLCNNDIQITDKTFLNKVLRKYDETGFAVLGPREQLPNGKYYPFQPRLQTAREIKKQIKELENIVKDPSKYSKIRDLKFKLTLPLLYVRKRTKKYDVNLEHRNVVLHGAFLVFSPVFVKKFDGLDELTFMYGEESLLMIKLIKNGLTSVYDPGITILHSHSSATRAANSQDALKKIEFSARHQLDASKTVLREYEKLQKNRKGQYA